jgi:hypothetical protein
VWRPASARDLVTLVGLRRRGRRDETPRQEMIE